MVPFFSSVLGSLMTNGKTVEASVAANRVMSSAFSNFLKEIRRRKGAQVLLANAAAAWLVWAIAAMGNYER
jgi:hypothetical protein